MSDATQPKLSLTRGVSESAFTSSLTLFEVALLRFLKGSSPTSRRWKP